MTQFRFHTFKRPVDSFGENERMLGILQAGRYRGFDTFNQTGPLAGDLLHTTTGVEKTDVALSVSDKQGALLTPQGVMIYEDGVISLSGFSSNVGNKDRIDLIICEHEFLSSAGGQVATYSIIEGTPASLSLDIPVAPALTNPEKQTIIGQMFIPKGDANLNNAIYTAGVPTTSGGLGQALLDQIQQYTKMQSYNKGTDTEADIDDLIKLEDDGNLFTCTLNKSTVEYMQDKPEGTTIELILKTGSESSITFGSGLITPPVGYVAFLLDGSDDLTFANDTILKFIRVSYPSAGWKLVSAGINSFDIKTNAIDIANLEAGELPNGVKTDGTLLKTKVIQIGDWDMEADPSKSITHGIADFKKIRGINVIIRDDVDNNYYDFSEGQQSSPNEGNIKATSTEVVLKRANSSIFEDAGFASTSYNRGWVTITYEA